MGCKAVTECMGTDVFSQPKKNKEGIEGRMGIRPKAAGPLNSMPESLF
jgi:hypothetical protein